MDLRKFLDFLDFPIDWLELGLYSDELFNLQKGYLFNDLAEKGELKERTILEKYGGGAEHYRYGAFWYVLNKNGISVLDKLKLIAEKEPDISLRRTMLKDIDNFIGKVDK